MFLHRFHITRWPGKRRLGSTCFPLESVSSTTCGSGLAGAVGDGVGAGSAWLAGRESVSGRAAVGKGAGPSEVKDEGIERLCLWAGDGGGETHIVFVG